MFPIFSNLSKQYENKREEILSGKRFSKSTICGSLIQDELFDLSRIYDRMSKELVNLIICCTVIDIQLTKLEEKIEDQTRNQLLDSLELYERELYDQTQKFIVAYTCFMNNHTGSEYPRHPNVMQQSGCLQLEIYLDTIKNLEICKISINSIPV